MSCERTCAQEINRLQQLQQLDLSENKLESLPEEIGGLYSLTDLVLSKNSLEQLPASFGRLTRLSILKLDQNRLVHLTPNIAGCAISQLASRQVVYRRVHCTLYSVHDTCTQSSFPFVIQYLIQYHKPCYSRFFHVL